MYGDTKPQPQGKSPIVTWNVDRNPSLSWNVSPGYSTISELAGKLWITNAGLSTLSNVRASITAGSDKFEIVSSPPLRIGGATQDLFTVRPKTGLSAGTHTGKVTITTGNGNPKSIDVPLTMNVTYSAWTIDPSTQAVFTPLYEGYELGQHLIQYINIDNNSNPAV